MNQTLSLAVGKIGGGISTGIRCYKYVINYIFDNNWNYVTNKTFLLAYSIVRVENYIYVTSNTNFCKADLQLNIIKELAAYNTMTGLYYNCTDNLLYTTVFHRKLIRYYDLNLTLISSFSAYLYMPYSITGYDNKMFVGTIHGNFLVIVNKTIQYMLNGCNWYVQRIQTILFDGFGSMPTGCDNSELYLYNSAGLYQNKNIYHQEDLFFFDLKSQLVLVGWTKIYIYN